MTNKREDHGGQCPDELSYHVSNFSNYLSIIFLLIPNNGFFFSPLPPKTNKFLPSQTLN